MKKRWLAALSAVTMTLTLCVPLPAHAEGTAQTPVLVGLSYSTGPIPGANLENSVGEGYRLGFLDEERNFIQLGYTAEKKISVAKTQNVWYASDNDYRSYTDKVTSDVFVGCWHVKLDLAPASFDEAQAAAQAVGGFPAWIDGAYEVRVGTYGTQEEAQAALDALLAQGYLAALAWTSSYGVSVITTGTSTILFQYDVGKGGALCVMPGVDDSVQNITWFKQTKYFGGFQYQRVTGGNLTVSNVVGLDDYANCVISREMSSSWPLEALKAQAICARNYYETSLGRHTADGYDICPTAHCQAYYGMGRTNERTAQAAAETAGLRAWYQGEPVNTYYFSSDGGATEDVRNVWSDNSNMPYLCGVIDPYEDYVADKNANSSWTVQFTSSQLTEKLRAKGYNCDTVTDVQLTFTPTGNVKTLTFVDAKGTRYPYTKTSVKSFLDLKSIHYNVTASGGGSDGVYYTDGGGTLSSLDGAYAIGGDGSVSQIAGNPYVITGSGTQALPAPGGAAAGEKVFTFQGAGWGHNVGMSQFGAYAMALQGMSYLDILTFYYPGIEIY